MILLTDELRAALLANGAVSAADPARDRDCAPLAKFFNPCGAATWLVTELLPDGDTLFGLADLGFGFPELGCFSLDELASVRLPFGLGVERDLYFRAEYPLSVYAEAARRAARIVEDEAALAAAARRLEPKSRFPR